MHRTEKFHPENVLPKDTKCWNKDCHKSRFNHTAKEAEYCKRMCY